MEHITENKVKYTRYAICNQKYGNMKGPMTYIESVTHGLILVRIETKYFSYKFKQAKYNHHNEVMMKEFRRILKQEYEEQFIKGWFYFLFINNWKANKVNKTNDKVENIQQK